VEFESCGSKADDTAVLSCLRGNLAKYEPFKEKRKMNNTLRRAMVNDAKTLQLWADDKTIGTSCSESMGIDTMVDCYNQLAKGISDFNKKIKKESQDQKLIDAIYNRR
jgi:hypothetical protein